MKTRQVRAILAVPLLVACFPLVSGTGGDSDLMTEIHFCHFEVPPHVKSMNASFSVVYSFEIHQDGRPSNIKKLRDSFLEPGSVAECLGKWRLVDADPGLEILMTANWEHGVGWTQISIVGKTIRQRIIRSGDLNPYRPRLDAQDGD